MAIWSAQILAIAKSVVGSQVAKKIIDKAVDLATKALDDKMSSKSNQTIEELQKEIKKLRDIDVDQAKLIETIAKQLNYIRYVTVASLILGFIAVALVLVLYFF